MARAASSWRHELLVTSELRQSLRYAVVRTA
jgi:hypothetical protein